VSNSARVSALSRSILVEMSTLIVSLPERIAAKANSILVPYPSTRIGALGVSNGNLLNRVFALL